jgi:DNA-binding MarR family transcriptional regulator
MTKTVKPLDQSLADDARPPDLPAEEPGRNAGKLLAGPYFTLVEELHRRLDEAGYGDVRPAHGTVFQVVGASGSRVTELAARAGMTKQAMTELVVHLEAGGYMERAPDPSDGRARLVRLTRRGWECIRVARAGIAEIEAEWTALIGPDRLERLKEDLGALNDALAVEPQWPRVGPRT